MENTEQLLSKAIKYYADLAQSIDYSPLPGDESASKWQLVMWLEELLEYKLNSSYLVFQYSLNDEFNRTVNIFKNIQEMLKDSSLMVAAVPNTASLAIMSKEELKNIYNLIGKLIKEDE